MLYRRYIIKKERKQGPRLFVYVALFRMISSGIPFIMESSCNQLLLKISRISWKGGICENATFFFKNEI